MAALSSPRPLAVGETNQNTTETITNSKPTQSYAAQLQQNSVSKVDLIPVAVVHGDPTIEFTMDQVNEFTREEGLHQAVVMKFAYGKPELQDIRKNLPTQFDIQGRCNIGLLEYRHLLIRFDLFNDFVKFLSRSTGYMKSKGDEFFYRTFPWSLGFNPKEETSMAVVWISFPGLPPNFFAKRSLLSIASAVGKVLAVDKATQERTRPSAARVKVILDLMVKHPNKVKIVMTDRVTGKSIVHEQEIVYDNLPSYCTYCKHQGHKEISCRVRQRKVDEEAAEVQTTEGINLQENATRPHEAVSNGVDKDVLQDNQHATLDPKVKTTGKKLLSHAAQGVKNSKTGQWKVVHRPVAGHGGVDVQGEAATVENVLHSHAVGPLFDNKVTIKNCDTNVQTYVDKVEHAKGGSLGVHISKEKEAATVAHVIEIEKEAGHGEESGGHGDSEKEKHMAAGNTLHHAATVGSSDKAPLKGINNTIPSTIGKAHVGHLCLVTAELKEQIAGHVKAKEAKNMEQIGKAHAGYVVTTEMEQMVGHVEEKSAASHLNNNHVGQLCLIENAENLEQKELCAVTQREAFFTVDRVSAEAFGDQVSNEAAAATVDRVTTEAATVGLNSADLAHSSSNAATSSTTASNKEMTKSNNWTEVNKSPSKKQSPGVNQIGPSNVIGVSNSFDVLVNEGEHIDDRVGPETAIIPIDAQTTDAAVQADRATGDPNLVAEKVIKSKLWLQQHDEDDEEARAWEAATNSLSWIQHRELDDQEDLGIDFVNDSSDDGNDGDICSGDEEMPSLVSPTPEIGSIAKVGTGGKLNATAPVFIPSSRQLQKIEQHQSNALVTNTKGQSALMTQESVQDAPQSVNVGIDLYEEGEEDAILQECRLEASRKGDLSPMHSGKSKKSRTRDTSWDGRQHNQDLALRIPPMRNAKQKASVPTTSARSNKSKKK